MDSINWKFLTEKPVPEMKNVKPLQIVAIVIRETKTYPLIS